MVTKLQDGHDIVKLYKTALGLKRMPPLGFFSCHWLESTSVYWPSWSHNDPRHFALRQQLRRINVASGSESCRELQSF
jgi:hypothetical protein